MKCPACPSQEHRVLRAEDTKDGALRRRRECLGCGMRFWTIEAMETFYESANEIRGNAAALRRLLPEE